MFGKIYKKDIVLLICALIVIRLVMISGLYRCPSRLLFGIPCPLCGMTRAITAVLSGDFSLAFYYHPLWPLAIIVIALFLLSYLHVISPSKKAVDIAVYVICILLTGVFIYRHVTGSDVVRIDFESSLLYNMVRFFV